MNGFSWNNIIDLIIITWNIELIDEAWYKSIINKSLIEICL